MDLLNLPTPTICIIYINVNNARQYKNKNLIGYIKLDFLVGGENTSHEEGIQTS